MATYIIVGITILLIILSIILLPTVKIRNVSFSLYWIIALIGSIVLIATNLVPINNVFDSFFQNSAVNPIKILVLFFSMTFLSIYLDEVGFFKFLANKAIAKSSGSQFKLLLILYLLTSFLTVFTSNDIVILTFTPFICYFCKNAKINPIPYLVSEFVAANTWSMMLIIGNPTNIYLATYANVQFINFFFIMILPTIVAGLTEFGIIYLIFHKSLSIRFENIETSETIKFDKKMLIGVIFLGVCLVLLIVSSYIKLIEMWMVSLFVSVALLIYVLICNLTKKIDKRVTLNVFKRLPYSLIPFVLSMFVVVTALNNVGFTEWLRNLMGDNYSVFTYGITSFASANLINNIPMSILYSNVTNAGSTEYLREVMASIIGSNLGAFLTPIGALAGIMFTGLLRKFSINYKFTDYIKYGALVSIPTLFATLLTLNFVLL